MQLLHNENHQVKILLSTTADGTYVLVGPPASFFFRSLLLPKNGKLHLSTLDRPYTLDARVQTDYSSLSFLAAAATAERMRTVWRARSGLFVTLLLVLVLVIQGHVAIRGGGSGGGKGGSSAAVADPAVWGRFGHHPFSTPAPAASDKHCPEHVKCMEIYPTDNCELFKDPSRDRAGCLKHPCGVLQCRKVDCTHSSWGAYSPCDATCGIGEQRRARKVARAARGGGKQCKGALAEERACHARDALGKKLFCHSKHRHCTLSKWGAWGICVQDRALGACGGWKARKRTVLKEFKDGECIAPLTTKVYCKVRSGCVPVF